MRPQKSAQLEVAQQQIDLTLELLEEELMLVIEAASFISANLCNLGCNKFFLIYCESIHLVFARR
jgi:hypothetical protein